MIRPAVLGAGSWGTALSLLLAQRGLPVTLWVRNPALAQRIAETRFNHPHLPGFALPETIRVTASLDACLDDANAVIFAVPSHAMRDVARDARPYLTPRARLISAAKGIEEQSLCRMSEVLRNVCERDEIAALSGPSFALEVAAAQPAAVVAASSHLDLAREVQRLFSYRHFRVYASGDLRGVELGGAMKNVIAIAAGVCFGLKLGHNAVAALITRGLAEMSRLAVALGAHGQTLAGLAGLGDLVLTCTGALSRNRAVGIELAEGRRLEDILSERASVAEGVRTANSVILLGRREQVSLPISEQMHAVLHSERSPAEAIRLLMERSLGGE